MRHQLLGTGQDLIARSFEPRELQHRLDLAPSGARRRLEFGCDLVRTDLLELVEGTQDLGLALEQAEDFEQTGEDASIVDPNREPLESECTEQIVNDERGLGVHRGANLADRVEVALHELSIAPPLGVLAAPNRADLIALERNAERSDVLGRETCERDRQIESHPDVAPATVGEAVHLLVRLCAALAEQDLGEFERRCVDRTEPVAPVDTLGGVDEPLARDHRGGQEVAEALEGPRLNEGVVLRHVAQRR